MAKVKVVFVVDDDIVIRNFLEYTLLGKGNYNIKTFTNVEECLDEFYLQPDLIVLDHSFSMDALRLTGLDGLKIIRKWSNRIPVIVLSGYDDDEVKQNYKINGASAYIIKEGYFIDTLLDAIEMKRWN